MKKIIFCIIIFIILFNLNSKESINEKTKKVINLLETYNINKIDLSDDKVVMEIKKIFIKNLDPDALYFTKKDINNLLLINFTFQDLKKSKTNEFFDRSLILYKQRLEESLNRITKIIESPIDYQLNETYKISINPDFSKDAVELFEKWKKRIKYKLLIKNFYKYKSDNSSDINKIFKKNESAIKLIVEKNEKKIIEKILNNSEGIENIVEYYFLNAITLRFDPHSEFLSNNDKKNFESTFSNNNYSFGFYLKENNKNVIMIDRIVPGGAAWESLKINNDDIVLEIKIPNSGKTIDFSDIDLMEARDIINDNKIQKIIIKILKKTNLTVEVALSKKNLKTEENLVTSFILKGQKTIAYINLPSFYNDSGNDYTKGCANDFAKELMKLKKDKIDGLIIDLRNNTGGSVEESLNLAGIFIDEGPLIIESSKGIKPVVLRDLYRGTIYDGPLVIMINRYSASSSEIFSSVIKDYNRAIIVGENSYGKATGQIILPLDFNANKNNSINFNPNGQYFIKVTTKLYYNLNNNSFQRNGIEPDIIFPDFLENIDEREKTLNYSIIPEKITKSVVFSKNKSFPIDNLRKENLTKIFDDKNFQQLIYLNQEFKQYFNNSVEVPLDLKKFMKYMNRGIEIIDLFEKNLKRKTSQFIVENNSFDKEINKIDSYRKKLDNMLFDEIQNDIYIEATYRIINDFINLK